MRDLSLHVLDILENSIRAQATLIAVTIEADDRRNLLRLCIEDNGPGLDLASEQVTDPFFTTKEGKRVGLGLSFFKATAESAGGKMILTQSSLGGLSVEATLELNHIDRLPLGDLPATFFTAACTNPHIDFHCRLIRNGQTHEIKCSEIIAPTPIRLAQAFSETIKSVIESLQIM